MKSYLGVLAVLLALFCQASARSEPHYRCQNEIALEEVISQVLLLKESVDATAKEHWDALQSLRFHLISARSGLKQAIQEVQELREEVAECKSLANSTSRPVYYTPTFPPTTTDAPAECSWPAEQYQSRCYLTYWNELKTWEEAYAECKSVGGILPGPEGLSELRDYLTEQLGVNSESRVRWSMWAGARQQVDGWHWVGASCGALPEVPQSAWAESQPHHSSALEATPYCMSLDGFNGYAGAATPCTASRRFVCDVTNRQH